MASRSRKAKKQARQTRKKKGDSNCEICVVCDKEINDDTEDSIFCEGECQGWIHRVCAGMSQKIFQTLDNPDTPFLCHYCHNNKQNLVIEDLKQQVTLLESALSTLRSKLPSEAPVLKTNSKPPSGTYAQVATSINPSIASSPQLNPNSNSHQYPKHEKHEKKYNIVVYGIKESVKGSSRSCRCKHDFQAIFDVIRNVDNSVPETLVRDCTRLGKYHEAKSRPILVKLTRTSDVQSILANRAKLANMPGISIKPDMTQEQRKTEKILLHERKKLIQNGTDKKIIKLRGNCLYVQGQKHGSVTNFVYKAKVSPPETTSNATDSEPDSQ